MKSDERLKVHDESNIDIGRHLFADVKVKKVRVRELEREGWIERYRG